MTIDEHVDKALMMERPYGCVDAAGTRIYDLKTLEITWNPQLLSSSRPTRPESASARRRTW